MPNQGSGNFFPRGQCTWWATNRYQQLTGKYVAWGGNANTWAQGASGAGWIVSSRPPPANSNTPAIVVLQPGVQGAGGLGHVAVIEGYGPNGRVVTSNLNWAGNQSTPTIVNFAPGPGVQFAWYPGATRLSNAPQLPTGLVAAGTGGGAAIPPPVNQRIPANATGNNQAGNPNSANTSNPLSGLQYAANFAATYAGQLSLLQQVHNTLISNDGFLGIALALDEAEKFPGWVNLATGPTDVIGICRSIGASVADNFPPLAIRGTLMVIGAAIFVLLILKVALPAVESAARGVESIAPLLA